MEKFNAGSLMKKAEDAKAKIKEGEAELSGVKEAVDENLDILSHEASMDYMEKLNADLKEAIDGADQAKAQEILKDIFDHKESMKVYAAKARENVGNYVDSKGEVNVEEFEKQMNDFMEETLVIMYGKDKAAKANIKMLPTSLGEMNYEAMRESDSSKFGEFTMNPEMAKMNFAEKEPKIKILDMKEFFGRPRSEVMKAVVEKYGSSYHIPGLEFEKFLLENPDKVPKEMKDGNFYYFPGSTLRDKDGDADVPSVGWGGVEFGRGAGWLDGGWNSFGRVLLLEK